MTPDSDPPPPMHLSIKLEDGFFLGFVLLVSVAFALVIEPFFAAILWGVIVAIVFAPVRVKRSTRRSCSSPPKTTSGKVPRLRWTLSVKFVVSTTRVFPSQWPRESPSHCRTVGER